jgi:hypothetical protein
MDVLNENEERCGNARSQGEADQRFTPRRQSGLRAYRGQQPAFAGRVREVGKICERRDGVVCKPLLSRKSFNRLSERLRLRTAGAIFRNPV